MSTPHPSAVRIAEILFGAFDIAVPPRGCRPSAVTSCNEERTLMTALFNDAGTDNLNIYRPPVPPVPVPDGYIMDSKGRMTPAAMVKASQMLEDQMVRKVLGYACDLANQVRRFRAHVFADTGAFQSLLLEQYGIEKTGAKGKGNVTFSSFDGLMKFQIAIGERLAFGAELGVAREAFRQCIQDWTDGARDELRVLVDEAFEADKEGNVSREAIFRLLRIDIGDARWQAGQAAIRDSIRVVGSKAYLRFYVRTDHEGEWQAIPIDLASS